MSTIENSLCDAIEILVDDAIAKADFDKTILCTVVECIDSTVGRYSVRFQDSQFHAFSRNTDVNYPKGSEVYVLIPNNDMSKDKTIIGAVKQLGINYVDNITDDEKYEQIGSNIILSQSSNGYKLKSYKDIDEIVLYDKDKINNDIKIDLDSLLDYAKKSSSLMVNMKVRTSLEPLQQQRGNYGIQIDAVFQDSASGKDVIRTYVLDVNTMVGNPYSLTLHTLQTKAFNIDGEKLKEIKSIKLFSENFPITVSGADLNKKPYDIFINDLEISFCNRLSTSDLNGIVMTFLTPKGIIFKNDNADGDTLPITAQVRVKGKVLDPNTQNVSFYWFREDMTVTSKSEYYCKYGGKGWKCLNNFNLIQGETNGEAPLIEWIPAIDTYDIPYEDASAKETRIKCVAIYEESSIAKLITITNKNAVDISIESDSGTQFYFDTGRPTLRCLVSHKVAESTYEYFWAVEDSFGNLTALEQTISDNNIYNAAVKNKNKLESDIANGIKFENATKAEMDSYNNTISSYDSIQRVENEYLHKVDISQITNFSNYKCSVYRTHNGRKSYLGTASITLTNDIIGERAKYTLILENGSKVYKYDEYGKSPFVNSKDNGEVIPNLTFSIYNEFGQRLEEDVINGEYCEYIWKVPIKYTLLSIPNTVDQYKWKVDEKLEYQYYKGIKSLPYTIANTYSYINTRNNIELEVTYQNYNLKATTDLVLIKEGENGTNGTDFVAKIVPNVQNIGGAPTYPVVTFTSGDAKLNYSTPDGSTIGQTKANALFKVQLWKDNELLINDNQNGTVDSKFYQITWEILRNVYYSVGNSIIQDDSNFRVNGHRFTFDSANYENPANIIKCTISYDGKLYYATLPILVVRPYQSKYSADFSTYDGFRQVQYDTNGIHPKYDNANPFEFLLYEDINGFKEDISLQDSSTRNPKYEWSFYGSIRQKHNNVWSEIKTSVLAIQNDNKLNKNQKWIKPINEFDGFSVNNGIKVLVKQNNGTILEAKLPIHLYLNQYGLANINEWDGNSVKLDEENSYILSPQVGAGKKDENNRFTGVFMGEVRESQYDNESKVGLFGYSKGVRSFFLNSANGSAILGKRGPGQIILDPDQNKALIYSSNFWNSYDEKTGLPSSYGTSNYKKQGMLIDLTTPEIKFGSGNFEVNSSGHLTAKGGGSIAGWNIDDYKIYKSNTGMSSVTGAGDTGAIVKTVKLPSNADNGYTDTNKAIAFWAGNNNFFVSHDGYMKLNEASIGNGVNPIFIGKSTADGNYSALFSGKKNRFDANSNGFYVGTDGIALGGYADGRSNFQVTSGGELTAKTGYIGNGTNGWTISATALHNGKNSYNDGNNGVYLGTSGIGLGPHFYVTSGGVLKAKRGEIGNWNISDNSIYTSNNSFNATAGMYFGSSGLRLGSTFSVNSNGYLNATGGKIGGWTIGTNSLSAGSLNLYSDGSLKGPGWKITSAGVATFTKVNALNIQDGGSLTGGGTTLSGGSNGSTYLPSGGNISGAGASCYAGGIALGQYIGNLVVDKLKANDIQTINFSGGNNSFRIDSGGYVSVNGRMDFWGRVTFWDEVYSGTYKGLTATVTDVSAINVKRGLVVGLLKDGSNSWEGSGS